MVYRGNYEEDGWLLMKDKYEIIQQQRINHHLLDRKQEQNVMRRCLVRSDG